MYNKEAITNLSDNDLRVCIKELAKAVWPEDNILRKVTIDVYGPGSDDVMHMLGLGVNFALEIEKRTQKAPEMLEIIERILSLSEKTCDGNLLQLMAALLTIKELTESLLKELE